MSSPYRWIVLVLLLVAQTGAGLSVQTIPALSPFLIADLGLTRGGLGLLVSAIQVGMVLGMFSGGLVVDRLGERPTLIGAPLIVSLAMVSLLGYSLYWLPVALFLIGLGAAVGGPAASKGAFLWFPLQERGQALGLIKTGVPIGGALAAFFLPYAALQYGWTVAASLSGGFTLFVAVLAFSLYRNGPQPPAQRGEGLFKAALLHFRGRKLIAVTTWSFALMAGQFTLSTYLVLFFHEQVKMPLTAALPLLLLVQVAGAVGRVVLGWASDRLWGGNRRTGLILATLMGIAVSLSFTLLPISILILAAPLFAVVAGFALIGWTSLGITLVMELVPAREAASTTGFYMGLTQLSAAIGPACFGFLVDATGSYRPAWFLLSVILALGLLIGIRTQFGTDTVGEGADRPVLSADAASADTASAIRSIE